jgi:hypothetical protein
MTMITFEVKNFYSSQMHSYNFQPPGLPTHSKIDITFQILTSTRFFFDNIWPAIARTYCF